MNLVDIEFLVEFAAWGPQVVGKRRRDQVSKTDHVLLAKSSDFYLEIYGGVNGTSGLTKELSLKPHDVDLLVRVIGTLWIVAQVKWLLRITALLNFESIRRGRVLHLNRLDCCPWASQRLAHLLPLDRQPDVVATVWCLGKLIDCSSD